MLPFFSAPHFATADRTERAATFHVVAWATFVVVTVTVAPITLLNPGAWIRGITTILTVDALVLALLLMNHRGWTTAASGLLIVGLIARVSYNALDQGGIQSPGMAAYLLFPLMAGVLIGEVAGLITGVTCVLLALGFVLLASANALPPQTIVYTPFSRWLLLSLYIGITLGLVRIAAMAHARAMRRAESELVERREAEGRLSLVLEAGGVGTWQQELATGNLRGDPRTMEILGLAGEEVISVAHWLNVVHPDDRQDAMATLRALTSGAPRARVPYRVIRPDGTVRYVDGAGVSLRDNTGTVTRVVGLVIDRTDDRRDQLEREQLLHDVGERVKELSLLHAATRLIQGNAVTRELLEQLAIRIPSAMQRPDLCEARVRIGDMVGSSARFRESPASMAVEFLTRAGHGRIEVCYFGERPRSADDPFLAEERTLIESISEILIATIDRDFAELQERELVRQLRQSQKMDALGTLAGGIAHDFNNILTAVIGNASLALSEGPVGLVRDSLVEIRTAGRRAAELVKRILLFSRRGDTERKVASILPPIEEALALLRTNTPAGVKISTAFASDLPPVSMDATQIHQVVMNLGTNAAHAMRQHGGLLTIAVDQVVIDAAGLAPAPELDPGVHVRVSVSDTGSGMDPAVLGRLFEPFFTTKGSEGTGLGLAVVHGIVRDHGGAITVSSEVGRGTTFQIFLPAAAHDPSSAEADADTIIRGAGEHILYVDDEEALVLLGRRVLTRLGYRCTAFSDPAAALQALREDPTSFHALITDMSMPDMTGLQLAQRARELHPTMPIIISSGYGDVGVTDAVVTARIPKPISIDRLSRALHDVLHSHVSS